jgi:CDP-glucose 4,6-dehydratase
MDARTGDILDFPALSRALREARPEVVFHLAAQALVRDSYERPVETFATNVMGTVHVLEAIRPVDTVRATVVVTSDKCYENREWPWGYRENDPMGGHDPYSASKGCAELATAAYRRSFFPGSGVATARAGNVIGGGDWAKDRLVPDILRAFEAGREVVLRNPSAIRPWQHVLEPLGGYLALAEALHGDGPRFGQAWNFGPGDSDARPVLWIARQLAQAWGKGASCRVEEPSPRLHEAHHLRLDISRTRSGLDWRPRWPLERALEAILQWHHAHLAGEDMRAFTLGQIRDFQRTPAPFPGE